MMGALGFGLPLGMWGVAAFATRERVRGALLAVAALGACTVPISASAADSGDESFTTQVLNFRIVVGADQGTVCNIVANLHRPASATSAHPAPALMGTNGFGGSKDDAYATGVNNELMQFAHHGYVGLSYSGLGFGGSDCLIYMDDPVYDGIAASQLAAFLGGQQGIAYEEYSYQNGQQVWSKPVAPVDYVVRDDARSGIAYDPRVGMIGASYGGAVVYAAAAVDRRIDTIVPQETWSNLEYSLTPNNADMDDDLLSPAFGVGKTKWTSAFSLAGFTQPLIYPQVYRPASSCPGFRPEACPVLKDGLKLGYPNAIGIRLNPQVSPLFYVDQIKVPVFISQGVSDSLFNLNEGVAIYKRLKQHGVPVRLQWMSWGHGNGSCLQPFPPGPPCAGAPVPGELDATQPLEDSYQGQQYLSWFGHWLKDEPGSLGAEFTYYRSWMPSPASGPNGNQYAEAAAYPVGTPLTFYLSGSGDLVEAVSAIKPGFAKLRTSTNAATSYSELSAIDRSKPVYDLPGTYMAYSSAPLAADTDVVGSPVLDVKLHSAAFRRSQSSGPAGQLILFAKIYDVGPDGTQELPNRLVAPVRIADITKQVRITLPPLVHRFAAGHSMRLVLAQGDTSYYANSVVGEVRIENSVSRPNTLTLPVTP